MKITFQNVSLKMSAGMIKQFPKDNLPQIAFSGRSNVGKSSLINAILGRKSLARVSASPGKTITVNFYDVDGKLYLVDLPGYGYAKRSGDDRQKWSMIVEGYFNGEEKNDKLKLVMQLIDLKVGPTVDDEQMLNWLNVTKTNYIVVATKADKLNATERREAEEFLHKHPLIRKGTEIIPFSALSGEGKDKILNAVIRACVAE